MTTLLVSLTIAALLAAVLVGCLLHLTPRASSDETRWSRLKRSLGHKPANTANPYAPRNIEQPPRPWRGK